MMRLPLPSMVLAFVVMASTSASGAEAGAKDELRKAIAKVTSAPAYEWSVSGKTAMSRWSSEGTRTIAGAPEPLPTRGFTNRDGFTVLAQEMGKRLARAVVKGEKAAVAGKNGWSLADEESLPWVLQFRDVAGDAATLSEKAKGLKAGKDGVVTADIPLEGLERMMPALARRAAAGGGKSGPDYTRGAVRYWVKEERLVRYEVELVAAPSDPAGKGFETRTTRTVEILGTGDIRFEVPAEAKAMLDRE